MPNNFVRDYINLRCDEVKPYFMALCKKISPLVRKVLIGEDAEL